MTLDDLIAQVFDDSAKLKRESAIVFGHARIRGGEEVDVIGLHGGAPFGVEDALELSGYVLSALDNKVARPMLVLVDGSSQRMSKRDELLGLNEYLGHLGKTLLFAAREGRRTIGLIYGGAAAGAFIATALSTAELYAIEGAHPEVMDLPSMSKVTKLPLDILKEKAKATPVFAPGLDNLVEVGAVSAVWRASDDIAAKIRERLSAPTPDRDERDQLGAARKGRLKAERIAGRVQDAVHAPD